MKKALLTGAEGTLAADLAATLEGKFAVVKTSLNPQSSSVAKLDVRKGEEVLRFLEQHQPSIVFHLAAETDVDLCERDPDHAYQTNTNGTINVVHACKSFEATLVYVSTGAVFQGDKKEPYTELDKPKPVNIYGWSKLFGEEAIQDLTEKYFIVRAGWLIGRWNLDEKFVSKILRQILSGVGQLRVVNDRFGSPTFARDFSRKLVDLVSSNRYGLYHMVNPGSASRYELAQQIVDYLGLSDQVKLLPVTSEQFPTFAPRPRSEALQNYNLELIKENTMPDWQKALKSYIRESHVYGFQL